MNVSKLTALCTSLVAITCFALPVNAGLVHSLDPDYVDSNGQGYLDRAALHPYVGFMEGLNSGTVDGHASWNWIDAHWGLMSAHQIVDNSRNYLFDSYDFGLGSNYLTNRGSEIRAAAEFFIHPSYNAVGNGYDLALIRFDSPFASITPVSLFTGTVAVGMESDIVGYGLAMEVESTERLQTGNKMAGNNLIRSLDVFPGYAQTTFDRPGHSQYRELGMGGLPGDSGGSLIVGDELAGISSFTSTRDTYGRSTYYSLIDLDWVSTTMASHPSAVPEPSSLLFLLAAAPTIAFVRKRKAVSLNQAA
ncbi:Trypsin [Novipirellula aureliae]|uniref:Trypsin n=1 Tax=Novipirellula aureliae TaxID=2527966 RepID=A0A5C6DL17_9BACT|nr:trypsin-like serine protease [Novipirellula aureliae]TWU37468.1 Trypsin [Novipirellula aureliae]